MSFLPPIDFRAASEHRWSVAALLLVNVLPLLGVFVFGWRAFNIVFVYWLENVAIGAINVLKMITCWPDPQQLADKVASLRQQLDNESQQEAVEFIDEHADAGQVAVQSSKLFFVPFFTVHYGIFCAVHGAFVCVLMGGDGGFGGADPFRVLPQALADPWLLLTAGGLFGSHLVSYFTNFLGRGEYRRTVPPLLMAAPYPRIVVLHIAIVLSGFFVVVLGQPIFLLVLLVIGKTMLDLALHLREHRSTASDAGQA